MKVQPFSEFENTSVQVYVETVQKLISPIEEIGDNWAVKGGVGDKKGCGGNGGFGVLGNKGMGGGGMGKKGSQTNTPYSIFSTGCTENNLMSPESMQDINDF
jgi:hypothetical protein